MSMELKEQSRSGEDVFIERFEDLIGPNTNGSESEWTLNRRNAIQVFAQNGFPNKKSESYKYTPVTKWLQSQLKNGMHTAAGSSVQSGNLKNEALPTPLLDESEVRGEPSSLENMKGLHVHATNGLIRGSLSEALPTGLIICSFKQALVDHPKLLSEYLTKAVVLERDPFAALASAFAEDGILIFVPAGLEVEKAIVIHHDALFSNSLIQARLLVVAEEGTKVNVIEHFPFLDAGSSFENRVAEVFAGKGARVDHVLVMERNDQTLFVNSLFVHQDANSFFRTNTVTLGGGLVRHNLNFLPDAEECETHLHGLYVAKGTAHVDNHTLVDHAKPNCFSNEIFKGIVTNQAVGVFNGKVLVRQDAQKTNAYQSSKCIVLDRGARTYAKPELEIYADDVKCSHGATTGELDEDALFYLRARGIHPDAAKLMLLEAFAKDIIGLIDFDEVRNYLYQRLHGLLTVTK